MNKHPTAAHYAFDEERLTQLKRVTDVMPSPCGTWAAVAVDRLNADGSKYFCDLWRIALDGTGAPPMQLTRGDSRDTSPCFRHDGALGFLSNRANGEKSKDGADDDPKPQVWVLPVACGEPVRLTNEAHGVAGFKFAHNADAMVLLAGVIPGVAPDKQVEAAKQRKKLGPSALHYTRMPVKFWDHWLPDTGRDAVPHFIVCDASGGKRRDLTPKALREHITMDGPGFDIAADGSRAVIVTATPGADRNDDTALLVIELAGGKNGKSKIIGDAARTNLESPVFSPDARRIACTRYIRSVERAGKINLAVFDVATGRHSLVADEWDRSPQPAAWSDDGNSILATADDHATVGVFSLAVGSGKVTRVIATAHGGSHVNVRLVAGGKRIVGVRSTLLEAPEVFVADYGKDRKPLVPARLSGMATGFGAGIAEVEKLEITSTDGKPIQYFFIRPKTSNGKKPGKRPTLLWIHGGPIGAWGDVWHFRWNALTAVARGYAVVMANPRGSTGFGQDFVEGVWGNTWGGQCYEDLMAVTDVVAARRDVDAKRMAAMGGSFGGYMTNWIGGSTDRFRCLVTHASIFSMSGFYGDTDLPAWWLLMVGSDPYGDPVTYDRYSPSLKVENWTSPTLVIHGEKDYRVGITQGVTLFECLQQKGVESELLVFPDENHWILKPNNSKAWYATIFGFLQRHLKPR